MKALDEIEARANEYYCPDCWEEPTHADHVRLTAALRAVLELHKEVGNAGIDGCDCGCGGYEPWCSCGQGSYPCPTVTAIQRVLEEKQ